MALYERLVGRTDAGVPVEEKILVHPFAALMRLFAKGVITGQQARTAIASISNGVPLTSAEVNEAQTLLATISNITNGDPIVQRLMRMERAHEIDDILLCGEGQVTGFTTPSEVKTALGV